MFASFSVMKNNIAILLGHDVNSVTYFYITGHVSIAMSGMLPSNSIGYNEVMNESRHFLAATGLKVNGPRRAGVASQSFEDYNTD